MTRWNMAWSTLFASVATIGIFTSCNRTPADESKRVAQAVEGLQKAVDAMRQEWDWAKELPPPSLEVSLMKERGLISRTEGTMFPLVDNQYKYVTIVSSSDPPKGHDVTYWFMDGTILALDWLIYKESWRDRRQRLFGLSEDVPNLGLLRNPPTAAQRIKLLSADIQRYYELLPAPTAQIWLEHYKDIALRMALVSVSEALTKPTDTATDVCDAVTELLRLLAKHSTPPPNAQPAAPPPSTAPSDSAQ